MALYKKYYNKKIELKFYPDDMVIYMEPKRDGSKGDLRAFKEKLQVFLNVKSSNFTRSEGKPVFTLQLDKNTPADSIDEYLKQKFHGGDEVEDPATMGEEEEEEVPQQQPQQGQQPQQPGMDQQQPPMQPEEPQMESLFLSAFELFTESTYRTAKYWDILSKASGRGKQSIDEKTVLSLRRQYVRKPKSRGRNETLRALDKAMSYFYRKMKNSQGENIAKTYKENYRKIGDLVPSDYSDEKNHEELPQEESTPFDTPEQNTGNEDELYKKMLSFEDFFDEDGDGEDEEDAYEKYEKFESET